jgi:ADP-ribose pyrophosphatase YjhB (NUDIX family)
MGGKDQSWLSSPEVPEGGLCLSSFLVLSKYSSPDTVLMGHLNPSAPWDLIGALDVRRVEIHSKGWMLPSSHLIIKESPQEAAKRIAKEQLGLEDLRLSDPRVVSEVSTPKRFPDLPRHWDIEFIFLGNLEEGEVRSSDAWKELHFINPSTTKRSEIARSHEDILESAGFKFGPQ